MLRIIVLFFAVAMMAISCNQEGEHNHEGHDHDSHDDGDHDHADADGDEEGMMVYPKDSLGADGRHFRGLRISEAGAGSLVSMTTMMTEGKDMSNVKIEGPVNAVCGKMGCWMTMTLPDGENMRVTFKDYGFFVPKDSASIVGKTAVIEGRAYYDTTTVAMLRHYAEDGGMSADEAIATITEPEIGMNFEATGVIVK